MKKKIVLAFSGGLDTSIILKWLQNEYDAEVITFTADIGQGIETNDAKEKAKQLGVKHIFVEKPLCLTLSELKEIETAFKQASEQASLAPIIMVGFNRRFSPQVQKMKQSLHVILGIQIAIIQHWQNLVGLKLETYEKTKNILHYLW